MFTISPELAAQFPIIVLIVVLFGIAFTSIAASVRWAWTEYKKSRDSDLAWRAEQNKQREEAMTRRDESMKEYNEHRDKEWKDFFVLVSAGNQADISDMRDTASRLVKALDTLMGMYSQHDTRAQNIQVTIEAIKADISKLARPPRSKSQ